MVIGPAGQLAECRAKARSWSVDTWQSPTLFNVLYYYYCCCFCCCCEVGSADAVRRKRSRNRWLKAVTLINNPSLVLERLLKRYQLDVAAAADNVDDIRLRLEVITARNRLTHTRAIHRESKKTRHQTLGHNFTNYYPIFNFFTVRLSQKFVTKSYTNIPPHPKRVAALPCEIWIRKNGIILKYVLQLMMNHKVVKPRI